MASDREIVKTSCPRDCYDGCGIAVVKRNGAITRVLGDPDHPVSRGALCGKCAIAYNGVWLDPDARLLYPMKRRGPKGEGRFDRISWDEAISILSGRLQDNIRNPGPASILHTHYTGTCSALANSFPSRFFDHIGATEAEPDTICNNAGHAALDYVFGESHMGFDPRTARDSACILVWGANPSNSAPHAHKHWLRESDAKVIVIDPVRHETAETADIFLQPRPGSDAALAFGLCHAAWKEGFLDENWIREHTLGYEEIEATVQAATPEWTARQTGVPADKIVEVARIYGAGPSLLWLGQGLQRQPAGGNIFRACALLPVLTGNIGKPGAGFYYLNSSISIIARNGGAPHWQETPESSVPSISQMDVPETLNDPDRFQTYVVWNCNPLASNPDQERMRTALEREDLFTVVVECFPTDTVRYADLVLPAASFLEFDDLNSSYFHLNISPQVKCAEPMGESLPNQEIFRRLAHAMGLDEPSLHCGDRELIEEILATVGTDWDSLTASGGMYGSGEPLVLWREGAFPTPSGKVEIASARAEADGLPRVPQAIVDNPPPDGWFRLLSPAGKWLMNSSYGNDGRIVELLGEPEVVMHPDDASSLSIDDGDRVILRGLRDQIEMRVRLGDVIPRGALLTDKSRWLEGGRNVNCLHVANKTDMGESTTVHATIVNVLATSVN